MLCEVYTLGCSRRNNKEMISTTYGIITLSRAKRISPSSDDVVDMCHISRSHKYHMSSSFNDVDSVRAVHCCTEIVENILHIFLTEIAKLLCSNCINFARYTQKIV